MEIIFDIRLIVPEMILNEESDDEILLSIVELTDEYAIEQQALRNSMSNGILNISKARKSSSFGFSYISVDDVRSDLEASVVLTTSSPEYHEMNSLTSLEENLLLFSALPNKQLRTSQTQFTSALHSAIKLANIRLRIERLLSIATSHSNNIRDE